MENHIAHLTRFICCGDSAQVQLFEHSTQTAKAIQLANLCTLTFLCIIYQWLVFGHNSFVFALLTCTSIFICVTVKATVQMVAFVVVLSRLLCECVFVFMPNLFWLTLLFGVADVSTAHYSIWVFLLFFSSELILFSSAWWFPVLLATHLSRHSQHICSKHIDKNSNNNHKERK